MLTPLKPERASSLGLALVVSSSTPLLLLNEQLIVMAASGSFCSAFSLDPDTVVGTELFALGDGEWNIPQLRVLLRATASGLAAIDTYEMDLARAGGSPRRLVLNAHVLDHPTEEAMRLVLSVIDVTKDRQDERDKDDLARSNTLLLQELHHRVANSLQIISSVLMQRVRGAQSEETRGHLRDAHHRVMSIATLQRQLAATASDEVRLGPYLTELCASIGASMIADPDLVALRVTADDTATGADQSVSLGLIVTELVINALKHAFPALDSTGAIAVEFHTVAHGWTLSVSDNGIGMHGNHESAKPGLGTGIVKALAGQLEANVVVSELHPGTLVTVTHRAAQ
ncbi:histidine kinase dimerization/phosphoacceptor domain -containing protein [Novosphingobium sp.]|nr:histidine kinase dimerization/phosphoacceptor domain -containing protein [Novosphingobium sp.]